MKKLTSLLIFVGLAFNVSGQDQPKNLKEVFKADWLVGTWETKNEADWEKKLHDIFISRRVSGEWFNLTKSQLNKLLAAYTVEGAVAKFR